MTIAIENGIPIPQEFRRRKGQSIYPFATLNVGQSFVVIKGSHNSWAFLFAAMKKAGKNHGIELTSRLIDDDSRRVWRTA